jgi:hypothetical protein
MNKLFRATIQFNLDVTLQGESAETVARELHRGMTDILRSMGAEMDGGDPGLLTMQGAVNPVPESPEPPKVEFRFPN